MTEQDNLQIVLDATQKIWAQVFNYSDKLIHKAMSAGMNGINEGNEPILDDVVKDLDALDAILSILLDRNFVGQEGFEIERLHLNSRQQVHWVRRLAVATSKKDQEEFDSVLDFMKRQPVI